MFDLNLKDKVVLITGGSDGLGFASAKLLSEQGAKVVICGRRIDYLKEKANIIREATNNEILEFLLSGGNFHYTYNEISTFSPSWSIILLYVY